MRPTTFTCARCSFARFLKLARRIKRRRWARDGGVGASELVDGDGEDGGNGVGEEKACKSVRELRAGVIDRNGSNMPKAETPKKRR